MAHIECHTDVDASQETVFDLLSDLHAYDRWLPAAADYEGTSEISPPPVVVGTTYVENSSTGVRRGVVTMLDRPALIAFHQPMTLRPRLAGTIDTRVAMSVAVRGDGTRVTRTIELRLPWQLALVRSVVVGRYRRESERMLRALKTYAERRAE
jgi:carbon monoxide dehydrogenase subunit G